MTLYHQAVKAHVKSLLGQRGNQFTLATHMRRVAQDGEAVKPPVQLNGYVPLRVVTVEVLAVGTETTMDGPQAMDAGIVEPLQCANP